MSTACRVKAHCALTAPALLFPATHTMKDLIQRLQHMPIKTPNHPPPLPTPHLGVTAWSPSSISTTPSVQSPCHRGLPGPMTYKAPPQAPVVTLLKDVKRSLWALAPITRTNGQAISATPSISVPDATT